ncbi:abortive infecation protein [Haloferula helveola]|uniref:Abortive infecation protein n=1 Tax=Haloferula helveola TaxID=490095 RepID=A0ABM7RHG3_9BACT|nr:abortive infecation protein [Haloferula helveola]
MARFPQSDVLKVFLYVAAMLVLGAALAPWLYNFGMGLAEVTADKDTNGVVEWLGRAAERSKDNFPRFYDRSVLLAALLLIGPLLSWLRMRRGHERYRDTPWSLRLPDHVISDRGQPLKKNPQAWAQGFFGFVVAGGLLLISGWVLVRAGFFMWKDAAESTHGVANPLVSQIEWFRAMKKAVPTALVVSVIEEILFRGILLGIFLRAMRPAAAIGLLSFLFAFVHFLEPPEGVVIADPEASNAGFLLLGQILARFADPLSMVSRFSVLFAVGVVLGVARWRTASLWLPIGLHAGWIFCFALFKASTWPVPGLPEVAQWLVGMSLLEGVLPLAVVVITGLVVAMLTRSRPDDDGLDA